MRVNVKVNADNIITEYSYPYIPYSDSLYLDINNLSDIFVGLSKYEDGQVINPSEEELNAYYFGVRK